jgi:excisionase family DNA binding protein
MKHISFHDPGAPLDTVAEAARNFKVTTRTIRRWIKEDILRAVKVGGVVRISRNEMRRIVEGAE